MRTPDNGLLVFIPQELLVDCITASMITSEGKRTNKLKQEALDRLQYDIGQKLAAIVIREINKVCAPQ